MPIPCDECVTTKQCGYYRECAESREHDLDGNRIKPKRPKPPEEHHSNCRCDECCPEKLRPDRGMLTILWTFVGFGALALVWAILTPATDANGNKIRRLDPKPETCFESRPNWIFKACPNQGRKP